MDLRLVEIANTEPFPYKDDAILGQAMPNAKKFLITSTTRELIIFRQAGGDAIEGKCPLCGADVMGLPTAGEKAVSALPPSAEETVPPIKKISEEEK